MGWFRVLVLVDRNDIAATEIVSVATNSEWQPQEGAGDLAGMAIPIGLQNSDWSQRVSKTARTLFAVIACLSSAAVLIAQYYVEL